MFERWRTKRQNRAVIERVYDAIVARARRPALYEAAGVPDTVMGRYEALGIEMLLVVDRCSADPALAAFAQDLVDRFMRDIDHSLREIGIGYQGVPRRMRRLANRFYTRVADYRGPLADRDRAGLERALRSRAYGEAAPDDAMVRFLADHMLESADAYGRVETSTLLAGQLENAAEERDDR